MIHPSQFTSEDTIIAFLQQYGILAIPSQEAASWYLHVWQREGIQSRIAVALMEGTFFLVVTDQSIALYVFNERNDWYNLVHIWDEILPQEQLGSELQSLVNSDDSYIWYCCRKMVFEFEWRSIISTIAHNSSVPSELKTRIFEFQEELVGLSKAASGLRASLLYILRLFDDRNIRVLENCQVMHYFFSPNKYERWGLSREDKDVLNRIGDAFDQGTIPSTEMIQSLIARVTILQSV